MLLKGFRPSDGYQHKTVVEFMFHFLGKEFKGSMFAIAKDVKIQIEFNPKHVQSYRLICKKLNISPEETISFEDTSKGIEAAKKIGVLCCGIKDEISLQDLSQADIVVHGSLENIISLAPLIAKSEPKKAIEIIGNYLTDTGAKK